MRLCALTHDQDPPLYFIASCYLTGEHSGLGVSYLPLHLFRRNFKNLKTKFKKFTFKMHVNVLNLVFNFLKLRIKRCRCILFSFFLLIRICFNIPRSGVCCQDWQEISAMRVGTSPFWVCWVAGNPSCDCCGSMTAVGLNCTPWMPGVGMYTCWYNFSLPYPD